MYKSIRKASIARMAAGNRNICSTVGLIGRTAGNILALRGIKDTVILLHAPAGCGYYNKLGPRLRTPYDRLHCSGMDEKDIVLGCDDKLADTIEDIIQTEKPALIAVLPGACSEMIHSDIFEAVGRFKDDPRCAVIGVHPKCFSHRNRKSRCVDGKWTELYPNEEGFPPEGCGSNEAVCALVGQLMDAQTREEDLVNAWVIPANNVGVSFCDSGDMLEAFRETLAKAGLRLNPLDSVEAIRKAPAAAYNLSGFCHWARMMNRRFGTGYYKIKGDSALVREMRTMDGARKALLAIAEPLGKREALAQVLNQEYAQLKERHEAVKAAYRKYRYAVFGWYWSIGSTLKALKEEFRIVPACCIYHINEEWLLEHGYEKDVEEQRESVRQAFADAHYDGTVIPSQNLEQICACLSQVDILIGGEALIRLYPSALDSSSVKLMDDPIPHGLSLSGKIAQLEASLFLLENARPSRRGLLQRLSRFREEHPEIARTAALSAKWWRRQWIGDE